jgi:secreted Zn-dependent insulinase-like peptidase
MRRAPMDLTNPTYINMQSIKDDSKICMLFQVPEYNDEIVKYDPLMFLNDIFNDHAEGSIYNEFIKNDLATDIDITIMDNLVKYPNINSSFQSTQNSESLIDSDYQSDSESQSVKSIPDNVQDNLKNGAIIIGIYIELTKNGFDKRELVANIVLDRLENMSFINQTTYNNQKSIKNLNYLYNIVNDPVSDIQSASNNLLKYDPSLLNTHEIKLHSFDNDYEKYIESYLSAFNSKNIVILFISNQFNQTEFSQTKYHNAKYQYTTFNRRNAMANEQLVNPGQTIDGIKVFIKPDSTYGIPKASAGIIISSNELSNTCSSYILTQLLCFMYNEIAIKYLNCVVKQGFYVNLRYDSNNLLLIMSGNNWQFCNIFEIVLLLLAVRVKEYDELLNTGINWLRSKLINGLTEPPHQLIFARLRELALSNCYSNEEMIKCLDNTITFDIFNLHVKRILENSFLQILIEGNISQECMPQLHTIIKKYKDLHNPNVLLLNQYIKADKIIEKTYFTNNPNETNYAVQIFYQFDYLPKGEDRLKIKTIMLLFMKLLGNNFFTKLRTEKQLGYLTGNKLYTLGNPDDLMYGISFFVQSNSHNTEQIKHEIYEFIRTNYTDFSNSLKNIDKYKESLEADLDSNFNNYLEEFNYNISKIIDRSYNFQEKSMLKLFIKDITVEDMIQFYTKYLTNNQSIYLTGIKHKKN